VGASEVSQDVMLLWALHTWLLLFVSAAPTTTTHNHVGTRTTCLLCLQQAPLALIVDHKMRPESTEEAQAVAAQVWHGQQLGAPPGCTAHS
jgi:hypothetical protein